MHEDARLQVGQGRYSMQFPAAAVAVARLFVRYIDKGTGDALRFFATSHSYPPRLLIVFERSKFPRFIAFRLILAATSPHQSLLTHPKLTHPRSLTHKTPTSTQHQHHRIQATNISYSHKRLPHDNMKYLLALGLLGTAIACEYFLDHTSFIRSSACKHSTFKQWRATALTPRTRITQLIAQSLTTNQQHPTPSQSPNPSKKSTPPHPSPTACATPK
jgi:hypothetical protein